MSQEEFEQWAADKTAAEIESKIVELNAEARAAEEAKLNEAQNAVAEEQAFVQEQKDIQRRFVDRHPPRSIKPRQAFFYYHSDFWGPDRSNYIKRFSRRLAEFGARTYRLGVRKSWSSAPTPRSTTLPGNPQCLYRSIGRPMVCLLA